MSKESSECKADQGSASNSLSERKISIEEIEIITISDDSDDEASKFGPETEHIIEVCYNYRLLVGMFFEMKKEVEKGIDPERLSKLMEKCKNKYRSLKRPRYWALEYTREEVERAMDETF